MQCLILKGCLLAIQGYLWCDGPGVPAALPAKLAVPWVAVSGALGMPPVLTYATCNLLNWRRCEGRLPLRAAEDVYHAIWPWHAHTQNINATLS